MQGEQGDHNQLIKEVLVEGNQEELLLRNLLVLVGQEGLIHKEESFQILEMQQMEQYVKEEMALEYQKRIKQMVEVVEEVDIMEEQVVHQHRLMMELKGLQDQVGVEVVIFHLKE